MPKSSKLSGHLGEGKGRSLLAAVGRVAADGADALRVTTAGGRVQRRLRRPHPGLGSASDEMGFRACKLEATFSGSAMSRAPTACTKAPRRPDMALPT
jgi:hypothetical protein